MANIRMTTLPHRLTRFGLIGMSLCWLATPAWAGSLLNFLLPQPELQTITVTDFTPEGRMLRPASPKAPIYYFAMSAGYVDLGGIVAGERPVSRELVNQTMLKVLAKQGYLPASGDQPAQVVLAWKWGTMNVRYEMTGNPDYRPQINRRAMTRFLGGDKVGLDTGVMSQFPEYDLAPGVFQQIGPAADLVEISHEDLYIIWIAAYGVSATGHGKPILLWNTRISAPSRGFWLPEALPSMLAMAAPCIGRETTAPVWMRASERFKPEIKLGDLKVLSYIENNGAAVHNMGPSK